MKCFIILAMFITACGPSQTPAPKDNRLYIQGISPEFQSYVNAYVAYKGAPLNYDIAVQFSDLEEDIAGSCYPYKTGTRVVLIDRTYWFEESTEGEKYGLIFHEFGHCDLNRDHIETTTNGRPDSIMYPYVVELNNPYFSFYINELFKY